MMEVKGVGTIRTELLDKCEEKEKQEEVIGSKRRNLKIENDRNDSLSRQHN